MATANLPEIEPFAARNSAEKPSSYSQRFWIWPNLLSLDAVAIALLWQQLFAGAAETTLGLSERLALALPVWMIYVLDRALDGGQNKIAPSARHRFYRQHRRWAFTGVVAATCTELLLATTLSEPVLLSGSMLLFVVLAYFLAVHLPFQTRPRLPKEIVVATVFSIGTALVSLRRARLTPHLALPMLLFALLCLLNCSTIEYREAQRYRLHPRASSQSAVWLARHLQPISWGICLIALTLMYVLPLHGIYGGLAMSAGALICFEQTHVNMTADQLRVAADLPLAIPALLLLPRLHGL